jgi:2-oxoglutarate dehydrogenase E2 component (dihydrolipoamide succinyltransferase)
MLIEVKVPTLSESVADATLANWHKQVGDYVRRDENLVDLETDKVMLEIVAPSEGVITKISKADGVVVTAGEVIATIDPDAKGQASNEPVSKPAGDTEPKLVVSNDKKPQEDVVTPGKEGEAAVILSPAAKKLVQENNIDPSYIEGSGRDKRITKEDVLNYLESRSGGSGRISTPAIEKQEPAESIMGERPSKRVPMSRLRARVAERLKEAQNTAAILTTFNEVNMQPVMDMRAKYKAHFEKQHGVRLGFMSFFVKAAAEALKQFPVINASVDGQDMVYHGYYDIGIAVGSPRGLVVPILRDADQMSFAEIEAKIADFGARAKDGKLALEELTGGTFSITNGGVFGSMLSTPILNPPQSAILGMHNIQERAVVENGEIVARPMMYLALSYDHRIIDGHEAVLFLVAIKNALEDPARMLLEI